MARRQQIGEPPPAQQRKFHNGIPFLTKEEVKAGGYTPVEDRPKESPKDRPGGAHIPNRQRITEAFRKAKTIGPVRPSLRDVPGYFSQGITSGLMMGMGDEWLNEGARQLGIDIPKAPPRTRTERAAKIAGQGLGFAVPLTKGAQVVRGLQYAPRVVKAVAGAIANPFTKHPAISLASEATAGFGASMGEDIGGVPGQIVGTVTGGLLPFVAPRAAATILLPYKLAKWAYGFGKGLIKPFTQSGGKGRAQAQVSGRVKGDIGTAKSALDQPYETNLMPAEKIADANALAFFREGLSPQELQQARIRLEGNQDALLRAMEEIGGDRGVLDGTLRQARANADRQIAALTRQTGAPSKEAASNIYAEEVSKALKAARGIEAQLWRLPGDPEVGTTNLYRAYNEILKGTATEPPLARIRQGAMPEGASKFLGDPPTQKAPQDRATILAGEWGVETVPKGGVSKQYGTHERISEVHGFYSEMRAIQRAENAVGGDPYKAKLAGKLANAAWLDLTTGDLPGRFGAQLQAARAFSLAEKQPFNQHAVRKVVGRQKTGEAAVATAKAIPETVVAPKIGGALGVDAAERALRFGIEPPLMPSHKQRLPQRTVGPFQGRDPSTGMESIDDYLKLEFLESAREGGVEGGYNAKGARTWMTQRKDLLTRRPDLRRDLTNAMGAMERVDRVSGIRAKVKGIVTGASPADELARFVNTAPPADMPAIRSQLLEGGLFPAGRISKKGVENLPQPRTFQRFLRDPALRGSLEKVFGKPGLRRLESLTDELRKVDMALRPTAEDITVGAQELLVPPDLEASSKILLFLAGSSGGWTSSQITKATGAGAGALRQAHKLALMSETKLAKMINKHPDALLAAAATDDKLYKALLTRMDSPGAGNAAERVIAWARREFGAGALSARERTIPITLGGVSGGRLPFVQSDEQSVSPTKLTQEELEESLVHGELPPRPRR